jgi:hypothetical protein
MVSLRLQSGFGPVELSGEADGLCERHLFFDNVAGLAAAVPRLQPFDGISDRL